jgi:hypothetical protein
MLAQPFSPPVLYPGNGGRCGGAASAAHMSLRKRTKAEVCEAFIFKLRERRTIDLDAPGVIEGIQQHFQLLPTRYGARSRPLASSGPPRRAGAERVRARAQRWTSTLAAWMCSTTSGCWTPRARTPRPSRSRSGRSMWPRQPTAADPAAWTGGQVSATWTLCSRRRGPLPPHLASCLARHGAEQSGTRRRRRHRRWRGRCLDTGACQGPPSAARPTCRRVPGLLLACYSLPRPLLTGARLGRQALVLEAEERLEGARSAGGSPETYFFEVTVASVDQPKLLSRLSECLVRPRPRATRRRGGAARAFAPSQPAGWDAAWAC